VKYERDNLCKKCNQWFYYFSEYAQGRKREYCDNCGPQVKAEQNAERQYNHRKRQQKKKRAGESQPATVALLGGRGRGSERERGGLSSPSSKVGKSSPPAPVGGMFADLPWKIANEKRRALGLPALAF
jgi:hypothetical protein